MDLIVDEPIVEQGVSNDEGHDVLNITDADVPLKKSQRVRRPIISNDYMVYL